LILEAHPPLLPLLEMMECVDETVTFDALRSPTIRHDVHIPLLSLPLLFNSGMDDLSQHNPYLHCDASHVKLWRNHLAFDGLSIGLVWATSGLNQGRDLPLDQCLSWFRIPGITFVGLQKELSADHHKKISQVGPFANFGECFKDFRDTAAVIANLIWLLAWIQRLPIWREQWENRCGCFYPTALTGDGHCIQQPAPGIQMPGYFARSSQKLASCYLLCQPCLN
jgi:hypothetical protein